MKMIRHQFSLIKIQKQFALSLLLIPAFGVTASAATTLASWDAWGDTSDAYSADAALTGFTATIDQVGNDTGRVNGSWGSNDGTFGTSLSGAATGATSLLVAKTYTDTLIITLNNNSGQSYQLDSFHFDFAPRKSDNDDDTGTAYGFNAFDLTYTSGGLGPASTLIDSQSGLDYVLVASSNQLSNYPDYDFNLADDLSDLVLADGESAVFTLLFSGNSGDSNNVNVSSVLDNVAFQGQVIPEPSSAALLMSFTAGMLLLRRRGRA